MSTQRINAAEKDLEKFIKFLALKSTQVVVQSRLGEKIQTKCNPLAGNDWFNLVVEDHPDVYAETKKALALAPGESILKRLPLCVEISLKTAEGDQMILEVWSLELQTSSSNNKTKETNNDKTQNQNINSTATEQPCLKTAHAIYNRMGMLLKSLISLTRATPAYKLSRRQCPDSYSIYYRIYVERPQIHTLGEGHKNVRIGHLNTIVGNLVMSVAYRTKMTITPTTTTAGQTRTRETNSIMIDSNYFKHTETGGKQNAGGMMNGKKNAGQGGEKKIIDIEKPLRPGAFTDIGKLRQYTEDDFVLPETPPFEWLLRKPRHESAGSAGTGCGGSIESLNRKCESPQTSPLGNGHQNNININNALNNNSTNSNNNNANATTNNNSAAFKSLENDENLQQQQLQQQQQPQKSPNNSTHSQSPIKSLFVPQPPVNTRPTAPHGSTPNLPVSQTNNHSADDENLLKELNFPFASPTSHVNDLAKFYRDCYHAPPLKGFSELQAEICTTTTAAATTAVVVVPPTSSSSSSSANTCNTNTNQTAMVNPQSCSAASNAADYSLVDDLSKQLEQFETSLEDYDKLVSQFGILQTSSSTGSRSSGGLQMSN